jgi:hypothetical protein
MMLDLSGTRYISNAKYYSIYFSGEKSQAELNGLVENPASDGSSV